MSTQFPSAPRPSSSDRQKSSRRASHLFRRLVESKLMGRMSYEEYRDKVRDVYSGPKGALLVASSFISLHAPLGERLFHARKFNLNGVRSVLDVGSGAGQIVKHLLKHGDPEIRVTCIDISTQMLRRARQRIHDTRPTWTTADVTQLPFADKSFDAVTCGYVLEHLPDIRHGLSELSRVLVPGGRMLLLITEDNFFGSWNSRIWHCRTHNRHELRETCQQLGLIWKQELWFTKMHEMFKAGGICVEVQKPDTSVS
jgi:ubiquinone/menaquinone biosynthesis C-methylase UbiE